AKIGKSLSLRQRSALRRQCAAAKEGLLADESRKSAEITVLGGGSSLIGGTLRTEILREEALELTLDGFLPFCDLHEQPKEEKQSIFGELGLPYVSDPAVTRHLAAFLKGAGVAKIDAILFNGGFFIPTICRQRVADVVEKWYAQRPLIFENQDLDLAVSVGAAYYSHARHSGTGVLVRGGLPRAYFIGTGTADGKLRTVCLAPRGTEEGMQVELDVEGLQLVANKPVSFRLHSSLTRTEDKLGDRIDFTAEESAQLHAHAPLNAVIRSGKKIEERLIPVKLGARLTEVGTLEIWAESKISEQRWRLQFELRKRVESGPAKPAAVVSDEGLARAEELAAAVFRDGALAPEELPSRLDQAIALGRNSWPGSAIRRIADKLLEHAEGRKRGPSYEARWLNLTGFCLRPGFGFPGDDLRIEQARRVYAGGLQFGNQVQCESEWWIFWGRVAGGLNRNQQADIYQRLSGSLLPRGERKQRLNSSLLREMWRTAASLELLPVGTRTELGEAIVKRVKSGDYQESDLWCLSRLGARKLFYGPINQVLPAATVARWIDVLAKTSKATATIAALACRSGDSTRDLSEASMAVARKACANDEEALAVLNGESERDTAALGRIFGEELPSGLVIAEEL
ncbi:MAG: molecular chaperone DnaK, partial [Candidatus Solibacter usitatus]|nr:molecular chaperone DnaK [Candidatus Solibacter usitatus]